MQNPNSSLSFDPYSQEMQGLSARSTQERKRPPRFTRRTASMVGKGALAAAGLSTLLPVGASITESITSGHVSIVSPQRLANVVGDEITRMFNGCPDNTSKHQQMLQILTQNPEINPNPNEMAKFIAAAEKTAEEHNLTIVDPSATIAKIAVAGSYGEVTDSLNEYTEQNGFKTSLDIPKEKLPGNKLQLFKQKAADFALNVMSIPEEVYAASGLKRFVIKESLNSKAATGSKAIAEAAGDLINSDIDNFDMGYVWAHETTHLMMETVCDGDPADDSVFKGANPKGFRYGPSNASDEGDFKATTRDYGRANVMEDQATIGESWQIGTYVSMLDGANDTLDKKFGEMAARYNQAAPGYVEYVTAMQPWFSARAYESSAHHTSFYDISSP